MSKMYIKRPTIAAAAFVALATLAACSTPSQITTRDGRAIPTADKPEVDKDSDFVTYEKDGKEVQINKSEVQSIEEVK